MGHGTDEHIRRPKKVIALQGKRIISIATGSLHCVACSDDGDVFTWGDNDEGQLGDGTTAAIQRPRLVQSLQVLFRLYFVYYNIKISILLLGNKNYSRCLRFSTHVSLVGK